MNPSSPNQLLPLVDSTPGAIPEASASTGCGCGGCGCGESAEVAPTSEERDAAVPDRHLPGRSQVPGAHQRDYSVAGMTCGHCANAVTDELSILDGVTDVQVDLVAGGTSTVRVVSTEPLTDAAVDAALDEAGDYHLITDPRQES